MWSDASKHPPTRAPGDGWDAVSPEVRVCARNGRGMTQLGEAHYNSDTEAWELPTAVFSPDEEWTVLTWKML